MSKIFYDRLIVLEEIEAEVKKIAKTREEKEELWQEVDELVHHRVLGCILDKLPEKNHQEFLEKFHKAPYDEGLIPFLAERIGQDIEDFLKLEMGKLKTELLQLIKGK
jgi:hypothetical protein